MKNRIDTNSSSFIEKGNFSLIINDKKAIFKFVIIYPLFLIFVAAILVFVNKFAQNFGIEEKTRGAVLWVFALYSLHIFIYTESVRLIYKKLDNKYDLRSKLYSFLAGTLIFFFLVPFAKGIFSYISISEDIEKYNQDKIAVFGTPDEFFISLVYLFIAALVSVVHGYYMLSQKNSLSLSEYIKCFFSPYTMLQEAKKVIVFGFFLYILFIIFSAFSLFGIFSPWLGALFAAAIYWVMLLGYYYLFYFPIKGVLLCMMKNRKK